MVECRFRSIDISSNCAYRCAGLVLNREGRISIVLILVTLDVESTRKFNNIS